MSRQVQTCLAKICQNVSLSIFRQVLTCPGKYKHVYLLNHVNCHHFAMFLTSSGNFGQVPTSFKFHKLIQTSLDKERKGKGEGKGMKKEGKVKAKKKRKGEGKEKEKKIKKRKLKKNERKRKEIERK